MREPSLIFCLMFCLVFFFFNVFYVLSYVLVGKSFQPKRQDTAVSASHCSAGFMIC